MGMEDEKQIKDSIKQDNDKVIAKIAPVVLKHLEEKEKMKQMMNCIHEELPCGVDSMDQLKGAKLDAQTSLRAILPSLTAAVEQKEKETKKLQDMKAEVKLINEKVLREIPEASKEM